MRTRTGLALALLSAAVCGFAAAGAQASVTFYSSQAAFDAAFPSAQTMNFASLLPPGQSDVEFPGATVTDNGDTFTANQYLFALDAGFASYGVTFLSAQTANQDPDVLHIVVPAALAIAFDYGSYAFPTPVDVVLSTGDQFSLPEASPASQFIGFSTSSPITSITLTADNGIFEIGRTLDLIDFSQAPAPSTAVPEPAAWMVLLFGTGLLGGWIRGRRAGRAKILADRPGAMNA